MLAFFQGFDDQGLVVFVRGYHGNGVRIRVSGEHFAEAFVKIFDVPAFPESPGTGCTPNPQSSWYATLNWPNYGDTIITVQ
jgi:hypothetical protein